MLIRRAIGLFAGGVLVLAPAAFSRAAEGMPAGPAVLFPSVSITETYDSNIALASDDEESDWILSVAPALRVLLPVRRFYLEAEGGLDFLRYSDFDSEDSTDWFIGASGGADFPGGLSFKVGDTHAARHLRGSQEFGPGEDSTLNTLRATAAYAIRDALRLEVSGFRKALTYDLSTDRERVESNVTADLYWKFRPRISAIFEAGFTDYAYDSNTAQDGSATQVALGLSWDLTAKSTGFAKAGYQWKTYEDENPSLKIEDDSYYTLSAGLRHSLTPRTIAQVDLSRASQESDFSDNPYFLRTVVDARFSQRFTPKVYGRAGVKYALDEYPNRTSYDNPYDGSAVRQTDERSDSTVEGTVVLGFDVLRWLALEAALDAERRASNFDTFDYTATRFSVSAKAAF